MPHHDSAQGHHDSAQGHLDSAPGALRPRADRRPTVSVVIPAFNEEVIIARCLEALGNQSDPADEIIVVDNGSRDATLAIVARFARVRVVHEPRRGVGHARSSGFDAARGDVIARIDADSLVRADWVESIRTIFATEDIDGIGGGAAVAELSPHGRFWFSCWYRGFRAWHQRSIGVRPMLYGFNSAFRRDAWLTARPLVGADDEGISEDVDVTIALLRTGHSLRYAPTAMVKARLFRSIDRDKLSRYYRTDTLTLARHGYGNPARRRTCSAPVAAPPASVTSPADPSPR
ncbi:glycosyltransferase [Rathayibacter tritici]|uniref:Glycosyltransferase 2-like domain-containing protein n=1 Tax=Rathayibacter tritici TaxID=33888 RepID=A0A160KRD5_9MICO|nr:glycosyltransferase [Rathayibacter tritici]AND15638.1 hypothetical protein A6122_0479 [Rathayibacter tritici]PPI45616.1 hypothetical protein C5D18_06090 [Rathayibacter tritici]